ncbi:MAG: S8/S53 family peptidase [Schaalia georgiae]|uniref:S8/S53 family peptidase n=1 Tax=Schaalia georgiae TaxID=52768 RepID=A0A929N0E0_9ACTO|nr:S8/S53 family peptidase [Schaalia georgiae]
MRALSRARRRLRIATCAAALAVGAGVVGAAPTQAVEEITTQDYVSVLGIDKATAKGLTGVGVRIGVIDGPADTGLPELEGANVRVRKMCDFDGSDRSRTHGSAMVSILSARGYGVATGAEVVNYSFPRRRLGDGEDDTVNDTKGCLGIGMEETLDAAVAEGMQIISISLGGGELSESLRDALVRTLAKNVIVVVSTGNEGREDPEDSLASLNGLVGVGSSDNHGYVWRYSNFGKGLTVLAPGENLKVHDFASGEVVSVTGTSVATPIVAGTLAVTMQQWPQATPNQILQSLVGTAKKGPYGYPLLTPGSLDTTDPTGYPDTNPLMDKFAGEEPSAASVADYTDGLSSRDSFFKADKAYVYRGADPEVVDKHPDQSALGTSPRYHRQD